MTKKQRVALIILLSAIFLLLVFFLTTFFTWQNNYKGKLPPKTKVGIIDLSGKNIIESKKILASAEEAIKYNGISFVYGTKTANLPLEVKSLSADIPELDFKYAEAIAYDESITLSQLFDSSQNNFFKYLLSFLSHKDANHKAVFSYTPPVIEEWLIASFPELSIKPESAYFSIVRGELINNKEKIGKVIDLDELLTDLNNNLSILENKTIAIKTKSKYPEVKQADLEELRDEAQKIMSNGDLNINFTEVVNNKEEKLNWKVDGEEIITWLSIKKEDNQTKTSFDAEKIKEYLTKNVITDVDKPATLPKFEMKNGKVSNWQTGISGRAVDLAASANLIVNALLNSEKEISLIINEINANELEAEEDFKIKELLGTGHSNFSGSPTNRRQNIKVGAEAVHGMLIKPGDEFSLIQTLGEIDAAAGYLPELVIKGNKTIPEYGGGLCQIATTIFRSALSSGLPITARRNHSYRVRYYEPAGTDAAVYDPWPDVRFLNDTKNYILIQSRIEGNDIYFDFWGMKDGRTATTTNPVVYNIVKPSATKFIETDSLKPGEKKCTESAHNGADAYFDYTVVYPEGVTTTPEQVVRFKSHYVPWQEVCLIGRTASTTPTTNNNASSTNNIPAPTASSSPTTN